MEIAHRIGERGHRLTKERDASSGQLLENREYEYVDDPNQFKNEWCSRAEQLGFKNRNGNGFNPRTNNVLPTSPSYGQVRSQSETPRHLAIEQKQSTKNNSRPKERRKK